jgi:hypothetical protein
LLFYLFQVSGRLWRHDGSHPCFADFLVRLGGEVSPALATKLARFSDRQMKKLYRRLKERRWRA